MYIVKEVPCPHHGAMPHIACQSCNEPWQVIDETNDKVLSTHSRKEYAESSADARRVLSNAVNKSMALRDARERRIAYLEKLLTDAGIPYEAN